MKARSKRREPPAWMAKTPDVTDWFGPDQVPAHPGPYQVHVNYGDGHVVLGWACWSGSFWGPTAFSQHGAEMVKHLIGQKQKHTWRGRTSPSQKAA